MAEIGTDIAKARKCLEGGGLVAIPTETVYGLAANAFNPDAVARVFAAKQRPAFDPLIVHVASYGQALKLTRNMPEQAAQLATRFWPGPLTMLLQRKPEIPDLVTSGLDTVGIRLPSQSLTRKLIASLEFPLVAPSANPFGYVSPTTPEHVNDQLGNKIDYILDGGTCQVGIESTIVGFEGGRVKVHRLGGISVEELEEELEAEVEVNTHSTSNPKAPGMLENHYSPATPIRLGSIPQLMQEYAGQRVGVLSFHKAVKEGRVLAPDQSLTTAAKNLFSYLRELDKEGYDIILAELVPNTGLGLAINDRLTRASAKRN